MRYTLDEDKQELVFHEQHSFADISLLIQKLTPIYPGISAWSTYTDTKTSESETSASAVPIMPEQPELDNEGKDIDTLEP